MQRTIPAAILTAEDSEIVMRAWRRNRFSTLGFMMFDDQADYRAAWWREFGRALPNGLGHAASVIAGTVLDLAADEVAGWHAI